MKKQIMILALVVGCMLTAKAQIVQTMTLKNGSKLHGYMNKQTDVSGIVFYAEYAEIIMDGQKVKNISGIKKSYNSLSNEWKHFADENNLLDKNRELLLSSIDTGGLINNVFILEQGKTMKYIELKHYYALHLSDIAFVEYIPRDELLLTGIDRILTVKDGKTTRIVKGQCIKEIPGYEIYLLKEDGVVESIDMNNLVKDNSIKHNPGQSLFEQSRLLDKITTKDGSEFTGVITERNYELANYCFVITMEIGGVESTQTVWMDKVIEISKLNNPKYKEVRDIKLNPGMIMVNRNEVEQESLSEQNGMFVITPSMKRVDLKLDGKELDIDVEANFKDMKNAVDNYFIKVKLSDKKDRKRKGLFFFSYRDMIESAFSPIETVTSMNNTTKISYRVNSTGLYVFFNSNTKKAVVINVE